MRMGIVFWSFSYLSSDNKSIMVKHNDIKIKVIESYYVEKYKGIQVNDMYFH